MSAKSSYSRIGTKERIYLCEIFWKNTMRGVVGSALLRKCTAASIVEHTQYESRHGLLQVCRERNPKVW